MSRIIPKKPIAVESKWQKELAASFTEPESLLSYLKIPVQAHAEDIKARKLFPMRVPLPFAQRMKQSDLEDPLFKQVFTRAEEFVEQAGFGGDPLDEQANPQAGLLHKYQSRVLLLVRGGCAVNCRYCFRRHFPYADNHLNRKQWQEAIDYIAADPNINEVIYSGGDPLMAKDDFLAWLTEKIEKIPHITRIRIHTRLPVVIPSRVCPELLGWLSNSRLKFVMVLHINHAQEIDEELKLALQSLSHIGVTLLNQAVLLSGINDSVKAQYDLSEGLFSAGILPYYLHLLDKVQGASHFDVSEKEGQSIMKELIRRLPGYLVPKLVREIGGQAGKTPIDLHLQP